MINIDTHIGPSFTLTNRLSRVLWAIVNFLFFKYSPKRFFKWRSFVLRLFRAKVGKGVHIYPKVKIWAPWNIELKEQCGIADGVILYSQGKISIGRNAVISQGSHLCTGTHDYTKKGFPLITKPITIGDEVWVATEVFIHPGVTIGNGCVVGARAVVNKDLPSWMVCSGHPCVTLKRRIISNDY